MGSLHAALYAVAFFALCWIVMRLLGRRGALWGAAGVLALNVLFFTVVFPGLRLGAGPDAATIPGIAMLLMETDAPLPVPAFAFWFYVLLVVVGVLVVVSASDSLLDEFLRPVRALLRGEFGAKGKVLMYGALPLLAGWLAFSAVRPSVAVPVSGRQAHPSISYDEKLINPLRSPSAELMADYEDEAAFVEAMVHEGRHLYAKNCAPCHGGKADGRGLFAKALQLPPANFTDPGTIATLVESYAFKRVQDGGIGLPKAGTPWDSAMPRWKGELTDHEIFQVLMAEYDLAGVEPRVPEELH